MSGHTPTPWVVDRSYDWPSKVRSTVEGHTSRWVFDASFKPDNPQETLANARRIVAAVNGTSTLSTEALEAGVVDKLVEAVESIVIEYDGHEPSSDGWYYDALHKSDVDALRAALSQQAEQASCEWKQDPDYELGDTYHSSCGELWSFVDGGPKENRVSYCHHCGKPVKMAAAPKGRV